MSRVIYCWCISCLLLACDETGIAPADAFVVDVHPEQDIRRFDAGIVDARIGQDTKVDQAMPLDLGLDQALNDLGPDQAVESDDLGIDAGVDQGICPSECVVDCPQGCFDLGDCQQGAEPGTLSLHSNIRTVGVIWSKLGANNDGQLFYREAGAAMWSLGHRLGRISDGRLASSLFGLVPETGYDVMIHNADSVACEQITTQRVDPIHQTARVLVVDSMAPVGGDGSPESPLSTIQEALDQAGAGTDIQIRAGVYREALRVTDRGSSGGYLRLLGEPGTILDGSSSAELEWADRGASVYSTPWVGEPSYLRRDGIRMYHYLSLDDLAQRVGAGGVPMAEGWWVQDQTLFVRSETPAVTHQWQIPVLDVGISLNNTAWVWIEGLEIRDFGEGDYPKGIDVRNSHHVVIRGNEIYGTPSPIWVRRGSNDTRIRGNVIHQSGARLWPWEAIKTTDHENSGIILAGGEGAIVVGNSVMGLFNGIGSGSFSESRDPTIAFDVDVYQNRVENIGDDGLEPEGACINNRYWNNVVEHVHHGISLAPITFGPTWLLRNRLGDVDGGFKIGNDSDGLIYAYHNTSWTDRPETNGMTVVGYFENVVFRNNLIRGNRYGLEMDERSGPNDFDYDNIFTSRGPPVIKWNNARRDSLELWCQADGYECHGQPAAPMLVNPVQDQYGLEPQSPNVNAGQRIFGINDDCEDGRPDIGYRELGWPELRVPR